jgi:hypothetical protein
MKYRLASRSASAWLDVSEFDELGVLEGEGIKLDELYRETPTGQPITYINV